jgi:membrane-associated phospholipid phosphatase
LIILRSSRTSDEERMMLQHLAMSAIGRLAAVGELGVALAVAGVLWMRLATRRRWRASLWWAVSVLGCAATTFLLKLGFHSGDLSLPGVALENPSGHAAMSTMVYGSAALVISRGMPGWPGRVVLILGWLGAVAIGLSMYILRAHTGPDVLAGWALGAAWAGGFAWLGWRGEPPMGGRPTRVILAIAITVLGLQGLQLIIRLSPTHFAFLPPALAARL